MKKGTLLIALLALTLGANAQTKTKATTKAATKTTKTPAPAAVPTKWKADATHSSVKFTVSHLAVSEVDGSFKVYDGSIDAPATGFAGAQINFNVDVNSINTDNEMRDKHLKSDDFFNAEKFPKMTFVSTSFKQVKPNVYVLEGNLTIRDVTKKVTFNVTNGGTVKDPYGNIKAGFKATGKISRKAYGLKWSALTEAGGAVVGDEVSMILSLEFAQQK
jgi:polyisoprenoid-binding protein YceI